MDYRARKDDLLKILKHSNIPPRMVPMATDAWIEDERVHMERFVFDDNGKPILDDDDNIKIEGFSIKVPEELIPDWLPRS